MKKIILIMVLSICGNTISAKESKDKKPATTKEMMKPKVDATVEKSAKTSDKEVTWETLKTLDLDPKTKAVVAKGELKNILGKEITMKGFMMPLDYDSKTVVEFLFMPYIPSCMHVPPPPPNQLVLVKMKKGTTVQPSFYPIELTGKITLDSNKDLESSYKMDGIKLKELKQ